MDRLSWEEANERVRLAVDRLWGKSDEEIDAGMHYVSDLIDQRNRIMFEEQTKAAIAGKLDELREYRGIMAEICRGEPEVIESLYPAAVDLARFLDLPIPDKALFLDRAKARVGSGSIQ